MGRTQEDRRGSADHAAPRAGVHQQHHEAAHQRRLIGAMPPGWPARARSTTGSGLGNGAGGDSQHRRGVGRARHQEARAPLLGAEVPRGSSPMNAGGGRRLYRPTRRRASARHVHDLPAGRRLHQSRACSGCCASTASSTSGRRRPRRAFARRVAKAATRPPQRPSSSAAAERAKPVLFSARRSPHSAPSWPSSRPAAACSPSLASNSLAAAASARRRCSRPGTCPPARGSRACRRRRSRRPRPPRTRRAAAVGLRAPARTGRSPGRRGSCGSGSRAAPRSAGRRRVEQPVRRRRPGSACRRGSGGRRGWPSPAGPW